MEKEREDNNYPVEELLLCNGAAVFSQRLVIPFSTLSQSGEEWLNHKKFSFFSTTTQFFPQWFLHYSQSASDWRQTILRIIQLIEEGIEESLKNTR